MSRRIKVLVAVLAAALLLTVSGTAAVMAQEELEPTPQANGFLARVAEILDIPQESLAEAFQQARQEMKPADCDEDCEQARHQMRQMRQELRQARQELRQQWQEIGQEANGECDQARQQLRQARQELRQQWQELRQGATID